MSTPKGQHTIPRVYLSNFVDQDQRLTVYSKRRKSILRPKPKDALIRSYYYSQPLDGVENAEHSIETGLLSDVETRFPALYEQLLGKCQVDVDLLIQTLASMRSRSPAFREAFEIGLADRVGLVAKNLLKQKMPEPPTSFPDIWDHVDISIDPHRSLIAMAYYLRKYCKAIAESSYCVAIAPKGSEFCTSDNPVVWYERGFKLAERPIYSIQPTVKTRLIFPLNKKMALIGRHRKGLEPIFRSGTVEFSKSALREANEVQTACAWDEIVGHCKIPKQSWEFCTGKIPKLNIAGFNSDNNTFDMTGTILEPIRDKKKFGNKNRA